MKKPRSLRSEQQEVHPITTNIWPKGDKTTESKGKKKKKGKEKTE
jgi:hypothetical protein